MLTEKKSVACVSIAVERVFTYGGLHPSMREFFFLSFYFSFPLLTGKYTKKRRILLMCHAALLYKSIIYNKKTQSLFKKK
jgi:hypothetical protein